MNKLRLRSFEYKKRKSEQEGKDLSFYPLGMRLLPKKSLPNLVSLSRLLCSPAIGYSILRHNYPVSLSLFVYAGVSDMVDGYLARKSRAVSRIGSVLDPVADKALATVTTVSLASVDLVSIPLTCLIVGRDVVLVGGYLAWILARHGFQNMPSISPTRISKINTVFQYILLGSVLGCPVLGYGCWSTILEPIVGLTTVWSGAKYVRIAKKIWSR